MPTRTYIEIRDGGITRLFNRLVALGTPEVISSVLREIGKGMVDETRLRFRDSKAPDGSTWAPLSAVTLALRRKHGRGAKPLRDTGALENSFTANVFNNVLVVGTKLIYAAMQHFGAKMGEFGRYSQVWRPRKYGLGTFLGNSGTKKGFPIPWGNVPARPFLGVSATDREQIIAALRRRIDESNQALGRQ